MVTYVDDICIAAPDEKTHYLRLKEVLKRSQEYGIKFNVKKCKFPEKQVLFLGHFFHKLF